MSYRIDAIQNSIYQERLAMAFPAATIRMPPFVELFAKFATVIPAEYPSISRSDEHLIPFNLKDDAQIRGFARLKEKLDDMISTALMNNCSVVVITTFYGFSRSRLRWEYVYRVFNPH